MKTRARRKENGYADGGGNHGGEAKEAQAGGVAHPGRACPGVRRGAEHHSANRNRQARGASPKHVEETGRSTRANARRLARGLDRRSTPHAGVKSRPMLES